MLSSPNKKFVLSRSFLDFLRIFCKLKYQFLPLWEKFCPIPGNSHDHHFLPWGRELNKKNCPGGRDSLAQKNFPGGCPGGRTQLELTEILICFPNLHAQENFAGDEARGFFVSGDPASQVVTPPPLQLHSEKSWDLNPAENCDDLVKDCEH